MGINKEFGIIVVIGFSLASFLALAILPISPISTIFLSSTNVGVISSSLTNLGAALARLE